MARMSATKRAELQAWREANPHRYKKRRRGYYERHREELLAYRLLYKYNLRPADYEAILREQNYCCAICGIEEWAANRGCLFVDHDHATSKVRGLLCNDCNQVLGRMRDNPALLRMAAAYLERER